MKTILKRLIFVLMLLLLLSLNIYGENTVTPSARSWGITTQVSYNSSWVGGVFHLGPHFMIRPGIWSSGSPTYNISSWSLRNDFLVTFHSTDILMWYFGPGLTVEVEMNMDTQYFDIILELAAKFGIQVMINENFGFFSDLGMVVDGTIFDNGSGTEGSLEYITMKSFGLGAVIYIK